MEGLNVVSITDLILKADLRWEEQAAKRKKDHDQLKQKMESALAEEGGLIEKLTAEKKAVAEMESQYFEIEKSVEKEQAKTVKNMGISEADVLAGRATLRQFQAAGVSEKKKSELVIEKTGIELSSTLSIIRKRRAKILRSELKLSKLKRTVFRLSLYPAEILIKSYKEAGEFVSREMNALYSGMAQSDSSVKLLEHQLHLSEGKGLSAGHRWNRLTVEQAGKILFDPALPAGLIQDFKKQLLQFQDPTELINIILHSAPGHDPSVSIDPASGYGPKKLIQTGKKLKI